MIAARDGSTVDDNHIMSAMIQGKNSNVRMAVRDDSCQPLIISTTQVTSSIPCIAVDSAASATEDSIL